MKKIITVALATAFSSALLLNATDAAAQASAAAAKPATTAAKPAAPAKSASHAKAPVKHAAHPAARHPIRKKIAALVPPRDTIPADATKWTCAEGNTLYTAGDMKRDAILTVYFDHKSYRLPRQTTTTGADRFYDAASTWDLVVIPTKAMLFEDGVHDRLADECQTEAMLHHSEPAPTQSNELLNK